MQSSIDHVMPLGTGKDLLNTEVAPKTKWNEETNEVNIISVTIGNISQALLNETEYDSFRPPVPNSTSVFLNSTHSEFPVLGDNRLFFELPATSGTPIPVFVACFRYLVVPYILLVITCLLWEKYCIGLRDKSSHLPLPNGRMGYPVVGEMFHFLMRGVNFQRGRRREFGPIYRTHLFGSPTITVIGEKYVKKLLLGEGQLVDTQWPYTTRLILGTEGIVNGTKETHTMMKRLALRAFSPRFMKTYAPTVQQSIRSHVQQWKVRGDIHILEECRQLVARTMMTVLMGIKQDDPNIQKYISAADDIINSILCIPLETPFSALRRGKRARLFIYDEMEKNLRAKMESTDEELFDQPGFDASIAGKRGINIDEIAASSRRKDSVLVNILKLARLEGETKIKLRNLQNLSLEFIFAGTQSLQSSSSLMIMHLSQHPEVLELLRQEIKQNGLWDVPLDSIPYNTINSLAYTSHVVNEVLRVTPPIPGAIRVAKKTFELGGYQVPKGWQVLYSIRETHEMAAGEKNSTTKSHINFDPQYFDCKQCRKISNGDVHNDVPHVSGEKPVNRAYYSTQERAPKPDDKKKQLSESHICHNKNGTFSFLPFGKGARMCAGVNYALFFLRVLVVEIARSCDFELVTKAKVVEIPMTKPARSVRAFFKPKTEMNS